MVEVIREAAVGIAYGCYPCSGSQFSQPLDIRVVSGSRTTPVNSGDRREP
jgi:hypothetical protein